jgi:hypothetical protein
VYVFTETAGVPVPIVLAVGVVEQPFAGSFTTVSNWSELIVQQPFWLIPGCGSTIGSCVPIMN